MEHRRLTIRLDGSEDIHPHNADPLVTLRVASAYFRALAAVASSNGSVLDLRGCEIVDECVGIRTNYMPQIEEALAVSIHTIVDVLDGVCPPPKGTKGSIDELAGALSELTSIESVQVDFSGSVVDLVRVRDSNTKTSTSITTLRCEVVRAGGDKPRVRLKAFGELRAFVLDCETKSDAEKLGALLYREISAEVLLRRDINTGLIVGGKIRKFTPVSADSISVWKSWFAPLREGWASTEDIEAEIKRQRQGVEE